MEKNCKHFRLHMSNLLESVQIEAGRIITGLKRTSSRQNLYNELKWETLSDRRKKHKVTLMYKILNNYTPKYLYDMVEQCLTFQLPELLHIIIVFYPQQLNYGTLCQTV